MGALPAGLHINVDMMLRGTSHPGVVLTRVPLGYPYGLDVGSLHINVDMMLRGTSYPGDVLTGMSLGHLFGLHPWPGGLKHHLLLETPSATPTST